jgi:hypothetical protein
MSEEKMTLNDQKEIDQKTEEKSHETKTKSEMPSPGHPRFNEIYYKAKEGERQIQSKDKMIEELISNQKRLYERIDNFQNSYNKDKLDQNLNDVESAMDRAVEEGDIEKYNKLKIKQKEIINKNYSSDTGNNDNKKENPDIAMFKKYNPWYGIDKAKTDTAMQIDAQLKQDPNWQKVSNSEFLAEIARRTNEIYSSKSNANFYSPTSEGITAAPVTSKSQDVINLSDEQKDVATKLFWNLSKEEAYKKYQANM